VIETRQVTDALATLLQSASGKPVGRGAMPDGDHDHYYILYSVDRQTSGAPFSDLNEDATLVYQVTCVSARSQADPDSYGTQDQMEWLADKARDVFLGRDPLTRRWLHPLTIPGARVIARRPDMEAGGTPDAVDGIMSSASRFAFDLSSA
jgi:hypothetical protein